MADVFRTLFQASLNQGVVPPDPKAFFDIFGKELPENSDTSEKNSDMLLEIT